MYGVGYERGGAFRIPLAGGDAEVLTKGTHTDGARDVAVDATTLYWVSRPFDAPEGAVFAMPKAGGTAQEIAPRQADPHVVTLDDAYVYWATSGGYDGSGATMDAEIRRMPKRSGAITTLAKVDGVVRLVVAGDELFVLASGSSPYGLTGTVAKMPKSGGAVTTLAPSGPYPADLDLDETHVYWTSRGDLEMPSQGPCRTPTPCPVATTAPIVKRGELHRIARAGGKAETLATDLREAGGVSVGKTSVLVGAGGQVVERAKAGGAVVARGEGRPSRFTVIGGKAFAFTDDYVVAFGP